MFSAPADAGAKEVCGITSLDCFFNALATLVRESL
jgi:hypothetical protein